MLHHDLRPRTATNQADLTFHALAFVPPRADAPPLVHAASLHRPAWMRFASERLPPEAVVPIARDAPLVGGLCTSAEIAIALQRFATLHETVAAFLATVRRPLADLSPGDVARPSDLAALQAAPAAPVEIFRSALALAARAFAAVHTTLLRPFEERFLEAFAPRWEALAAEVPGVAGLPVLVSAALGPRGRLMQDALLVGTETLPDDAGPIHTDVSLALAAHEAAVRAAGEVLRKHEVSQSWALVERLALDGAALAYRGTSAEGAHAAWRAGLDQSGLEPHTARTATLSGETAALLRAGY